MFTSVNGVDYFFRYLRRFRIDMRRFHGARIVAVGPKTAEALLAKGLTVEELPVQFHAESLLDKVSQWLKPGDRALLPRGDLAREVLPKELKARGVEAVEIDVYETVLADNHQNPYALEWLREGGIHMITFTSSSTVTNLLEVLRRSGIQEPVELLKNIPIASIGPITSKTISELGLHVTLEAEESTLDSMLEAIKSYNQERRKSS